MSKTPVSILQEFCARNCIVPQYDLVINGVGTHDPLFKYKLTVNEVITYGEGKSKKEAKHDAAREALTLLPMNNSSNCSVNINRPEMVDQIEDITSPYHGALKENAIGELLTICGNNKLPDPDYVLIGEVGPPHAKTFTYACNVAKLSENASSRTKKQAKHLSAKLMIERLKTMLGDKLELNPPDPNEDAKERIAQDEIDEKAKASYANIKSPPRCSENFDLRISDYHNVDLTPLFDDDPARLIELSNYEGTSDPVEVLRDLFSDSENSFTLTELESISKGTYIYICGLESCPQFMLHGISKRKEEAEALAAHNMLCYLKIFCVLKRD